MSDQAMQDHPTTDELLAYPLGELTPERARQVFAHCRSCPECGDELAAIIVLQAAAVAEEPPVRDRWRFAAIAASAILVLALGALTAGQLLTDGPETPEPAPSPSSEISALATTETLTRMHVDFHFGVAQVSRQRAMARNGAMAIAEGEYDEAIRILQGLFDAGDGDIAIHLGIARYLQGDLSEETERLLGLLPATESMGRAGYWFLGNLYVARGDEARARAVLEEIAPINDRWGRRAAALLEALDAL